jgi:hypothetical protein
MPALFSNNASATLASSITTTNTAITVSTGMGAVFPTLVAGNFFYATLTNSSNTLEIVRVTGRASDVLTVVRAQDGTNASAYDAGDKIELRITAAVLTNFAQLDGTQTITGNKTFSGTTTFSGTATVSGALNAAAGSLVIPTATVPAQTAEGSLVWDSNDDLLTIGTGAARKTFVDLDTTQTITNKTFSNSVVQLGSNELTTTTYTFKESGGKLLFIARPVFTASIASNVMTVTAATVGKVNYGAVLSGTGVTSNTTVGVQLTSTETAIATPVYASGGAIGASSFTVSDGTGVAAGQLVAGVGVPAGTYVSPIYIGGEDILLADRTGAPVVLTAQAVGTYSFAVASARGTYTISPAQTVSSTDVTGTQSIASLSYSGIFTTINSVVGHGDL